MNPPRDIPEAIHQSAMICRLDAVQIEKLYNAVMAPTRQVRQQMYSKALLKFNKGKMLKEFCLNLMWIY